MLLLVLLIPAAAVLGSAPESCSSGFSAKNGKSSDFWNLSLAGEAFNATARQLVDNMEATNIEDYLKYLTSQPHAAGTRADFEQAEYLRQLWLNQGLDQVILKPYEVAMSLPKRDERSKVTIMDENKNVKFTSALMEEAEDDTFYDETVLPAYIASSASGIIETEELVFANYGSYEDLRYLERDMKINLTGRLLLIRYGAFFRGDKVQNAQRFGAAGVILYSDPVDYSSLEEEKHPFSWFLPGDGVQRGTIVWRDGDPSTPLYPALDGSYRVPEDKMDVPKILVHPIGFNDALKIMVQLAGPEAPPHWRGGLNTTYRIGPLLRMAGWKIRLEVNNERRLLPTYNVVGFIRGQVEPDRYVIYGNHRDAWVFGSVDPSSATASLMEVVRSYSQLMKQGWRPRRSIMFCSWGGSEQGYLGVTEWVEEHLALLGARAIAYLNVDIAVIQGYNLAAAASPVLHQVMIEASKHVEAPYDPSTRLYQLWSTRRRFTKELVTYSLSSVSDQAPFYQRVGVPCTYMSWMPDPEEWNGVDYPLYHSTYETFEAVKKHVDPHFEYHLALARMWAWMGLALADTPLMPYGIADETIALNTSVKQLEERYGATLAKRGISLVYVNNAVRNFAESFKAFQQRLEHLDFSNELELRMINDQLNQVEKSYIYSEGLPHRPHMKNVIFGTSIFDQYSSTLLPGVEEALQRLTVFVDEETTSAEQWDTVRHQLSIVVSVIQAASNSLHDIKQWF